VNVTITENLVVNAKVAYLSWALVGYAAPEAIGTSWASQALQHGVNTCFAGVVTFYIG
jgi:hypothetical protein